MNIGGYLIHRLERLGVRHIFGVPGDYILRFYALLDKSPIRTVVTTREDSAGFAADAYARTTGLGAVCVTYCVGGLSVMNPVAGAYAEKSPVVVIGGAPGTRERVRTPLLHHLVRDFGTQRAMFDQVTAASAVLDDPARARAEIDRVLEAALRYKRPVYLELPRDRVETPLSGPPARASAPRRSDPAALREAVVDAAARLNASRRPVIVAGVEMHRFGLQSALLRLIHKTGYPVAADLLGKSVVSEVHPQYAGVYGGALGREEVRRVVEGADCVLLLGVFMTDLNFGMDVSHLDVGRTISATSERVAVRWHQYPGVELGDFLRGLLRAPLRRRALPRLSRPTVPAFTPRARAPVTVARLFACLNRFLEDEMVVVSDTGDCLFGAMDLVIHRRTEFFAPAYYTSMGFAVPAALGAQLGAPRLRPLVLVGDGAFQMTGLELSTAVRLGLDPIVVVLNNRGYTTERFLQDGPFNDITDWAYHRVPELVGGGRGFLVRTEGELTAALRAVRRRGVPGVLNVLLDRHDCSPALGRLTRRMARRV